jgi:Fe-S-cluster containining protein
LGYDARAVPRDRRPRPVDPRKEEAQKAFASLEALYRDIEEAHATHSCPASTDCCRFGTSGREPYVTEVEVAYLKRALAASPSKRSRPAVESEPDGKTSSTPPGPSRAGKGKHLPIAREDVICKMLDESGRCRAYAARPLGCRTYYCERATMDRPIPRRELAEWVQRLKAISIAFAGTDEGRPLTRVI